VISRLGEIVDQGELARWMRARERGERIGSGFERERPRYGDDELARGGEGDDAGSRSSAERPATRIRRADEDIAVGQCARRVGDRDHPLAIRHER